MKRGQKRLGFHFEMTEEESNMIKVLRDKYAVNISKLFKNHLRKYYNEIVEGTVLKR